MNIARLFQDLLDLLTSIFEKVLLDSSSETPAQNVDTCWQQFDALTWIAYAGIVAVSTT
jgi:hypothetical protein